MRQKYEKHYNINFRLPEFVHFLTALKNYIWFREAELCFIDKRDAYFKFCGCEG